MPYSPLLVKPMRQELVDAGVRELLTPEEVEDFMQQDGTAFLVFNSVCGCAAGMARPGVRQALAGDVQPTTTGSVFAGQDVEATQKAREYIPDIPPSSPSMALFRDGELVWFLPRHRIEGRDAASVAQDIQDAFVEHCG